MNNFSFFRHMNRTKKYRTDFLFPTSSFLTGVGSVLNVYGNYYVFNSSKTPKIADFKALSSDWGVIGQDIKSVTEKVEPATLLSED